MSDDVTTRRMVTQQSIDQSRIKRQAASTVVLEHPDCCETEEECHELREKVARLEDDNSHLTTERDDLQSALSYVLTPMAPIPMVLHCPACGRQHVDAPDDGPGDKALAWTNPPHRSHLCRTCMCVWRPADVPTTGVKEIETRGRADNWSGKAL